MLSGVGKVGERPGAVVPRRTVLRAGLALPLLTVGCGGDSDDAVTFFFQARPEEARARLLIIDEFRRRRPDIAIRTIMSGPDPLQQMLTYCAGGKCPDVLMAWELLYAGLAERGVLADLREFLDRDPGYAARLTADGYAPLRDTFVWRGGQYALPEQWSGVFLYYNRRLFERAGVRAPTRWSQAWSFDEFLTAARALTRRDADGRVRQWGFVDAWVPYYSAACFGMNNGAEWFSPPVAPTRTNLGDPRFAAGLQFYADLAVRHRVAPRAADQQSVSAPDLFARGRAAMLLGGHWLYSEFVDRDDLDFDVTVLPVGPHGGPDAVTDVGTTGLAVAANSPRREQAWEFVKFATGPEGQEIIARSGLFVPVLKSAMHSAGFAAAHAGIRNLDVFTEGPAHSRHLAVTPVWGKVESLLERGCNRVLRGAAQADSLGGRTARDIDEILRAARI
ncbi:sugar ABC transporter substrate-binding protein [Nocardia otitidiscaviarum]|uniref:Sugar ABC transporter substrate-binding protein n=1 Tax=Nocardia otitidiscaviarum TaxID=1823 RepID=A0A516NFW3_9NOCA|nr:sugar ABC transporter substrate-binding protein [Nocardia otitidiscaviarum]MCP9623147.1 sugar ABC transporter substrate-binding protein [Nocardia otitidiscaviarum]QDP77804.1 sugar ABC transporter substrate-binding protein [Nocardia otitidiscaviarum]